jgi:hypothetical protein
MTKTLIIHHLEPCWEDGYKRYGTCFENLLERFAHHLEENHYDRIILTRFEGGKLDDSHWPLFEYVDEVHEYAYGWEEQELLDWPDRFCVGGTHSEAVLLEDWMKIDGEVYISGAFDGECVEDLEIALRHLGIDFKRVEELIV